jgi:hypothetical protein
VVGVAESEDTGKDFFVMTFHSLRGIGIGDCVGGVDEYGDLCFDPSAALNTPTTPVGSPAAGNTTYNIYGSTPTNSQAPTNSPSTGVNWGTLLAPLAGTFATRYAVPQLNAGQTIQTAPGQFVTQQAAGLPAVNPTGANANTASLGGLSLPVILGIGAIVVVVMTKK